MTKTAIAICVASLAIVVASSSIVTFSPSAFAEAKGDRCVSIQSRETGQTFVQCTPDIHNPGLKANKDMCKEFPSNKCSSSQTGFGDRPNSKENQKNK